MAAVQALNSAELREIADAIETLDSQEQAMALVSLGDTEVWSHGDLVGTLTRESGEYQFVAGS